MKLDEKILPIILRNFSEENFGAKEIIIEEGKIARKLYYIKKGVTRAWLNNDGKEITFQFMFEGSFISSWESLFYNSPSLYNIETIEPIDVYSTSLEEFRQKMDHDPDIKEFYYASLEKRLLEYQKLFISRIKDTAEQRYHDLFSQFPEIIRRIPQHYIASYLGITSVSLSRIRSRK
ncbi:Crp/Fnr family transcriptional regulator [Chryseobacterium polytrichastri]|uniref:cAMP-binding domain of CRP or a regulatory subunit of cAMP-dependent protein kinases n=1 Tax=Chryseobacterium polytrichastri TaxID=1302687 RepID=A0A1M6S4Z8_9FLAO|nr:Crp/Fnr family transcriptional regulator [Chryseobacterium polytrichastri]SHK39904.1 cAMP-binding domain of CRP or a regulatory subunit of cAMP-dependent protein kinases [Chryseobacterium polytrichastri]